MLKKYNQGGAILSTAVSYVCYTWAVDCASKNSLELPQNKLLFFVNLEQVFHRVFGASPG